MKTANTILIALAAVAVSTPVLAADSGNAENGKRLFLTMGCYECHGTTGMGAGSVGAKLAPNPIPVEGIIAELRHSRQSVPQNFETETSSAKQDVRQAMPQYSEKVISDKEANDIHAYLMTIPEGPKAKDIPILSR